MYRRNLDIAVAAIIAVLGGLAAAAKLPGTFTIPLGIGLFFAPGYLWSEAILSQRLTGFERVMTSAGLAFIFPIIGGFLFYGLQDPAVEVGMDRPSRGAHPPRGGRGRDSAPASSAGRAPSATQSAATQPAAGRPATRPGGGLSVLHACVFGLAAVIGLGTVAFSVNNAETQKFPGNTELSMTAIVPNAQSYVGSATVGGQPGGDVQQGHASASYRHEL